MILLNGKETANAIKQDIAAKVKEMVERGERPPHLVAIIVGEDGASKTYVANKEKNCQQVGFQSTVMSLPVDITEEKLLEHIAALNNDDTVDGFIVQLPLPSHIDENKIIWAIDPKKDVDGFHPLNVASLWQKQECVLPCTPKGIIKMLKAAGVEIKGKRAVVIGRSNIVGKPVAKLLLDRNATVTIAHSRTKDLAAVCREADILVAAVGRAKMVTAEYVKPGAAVIDVGINRTEDGKLVGDVDYEAVLPVAGAITPVPGGVGPMTITMLMRNTIECFLNRMNNK